MKTELNVEKSDDTVFNGLKFSVATFNFGNEIKENSWVTYKITVEININKYTKRNTSALTSCRCEFHYNVNETHVNITRERT